MVRTILIVGTNSKRLVYNFFNEIPDVRKARRVFRQHFPNTKIKYHKQHANTFYNHLSSFITDRF